MQLLMVVHLSAVIAVAFFPFPYQAELIAARRAAQTAHNNVVPLALLIEAIATDAYPSVINQSLGNVLLLMPVGLYLPFLAPRASHLGTLMLVGLCASLLIEFSQLAISAVLGYTYKIADIDDVILNTVGVAVGYAAFRVIRWRFPNL